jgi:hypothetical protein
MAKAKEELAVQTGSTALDVAPDFIEAGDAGFENITKDDVQMPRLALAQQMSPQLNKKNPGFIEGLGVADMFNSLTGENYGSGPLQFMVLRFDKPRWVEFVPREEGGGIKDFNVPANDPRTTFGPNGESPIATKFYDFIVMLLPNFEVIALSFKSTGLKAAKTLNSLMMTRKTKDGKRAAHYTGVYEVSTDMTKNAKGEFAVYTIKNAGWPSSGAIMAQAKEQAAIWADKDVTIHRDGEETDSDLDFPTDNAPSAPSM